MLTHTTSVVLFVVVGLGVALQLATVSRLGARIVMDRIVRHRRSNARVAARHPAPSVRQDPRPAARRRCRDYRTALRSAARPDNKTDVPQLGAE